MATNRADKYQQVTDRIIEALEAGVVPWRKPWTTIPHTSVDGHRYRGSNVFLLSITAMLEGYESPYWGTYDALKAKGGQVKKGSKGTMVVWWARKTIQETDSAGAPVLKDGKPVEKSFMMLRSYKVFNVEQCAWSDGMPDKFKGLRDDLDTSGFAHVDATIETYCEAGPTLNHGGDRACYAPRTDTVTMPTLGAFDDPESYYATLFHELTHSTGHPSRLNREGIADFDGFGSHRYGREELVAEMGAAMLCAEFGIDSTMESSAAYIKSWLDVIQCDPRTVVSAGAQAQRAVDLILGTTFDE